MKVKIYFLGFLLTMLSFSCKNAKEDSKTEISETNTSEAVKEGHNEISTVDREEIINNLQGNWKEPEYPFGVAQFQDTTVKFIEEGVVEEPRFQQYKISRDCPFEVNNIKNVDPNDVILVMVESGTCEKLRISNDSVTLSGFSAHTGENYSRIYKKEE